MSGLGDFNVSRPVHTGELYGRVQDLSGYRGAIRTGGWKCVGVRGFIENKMMSQSFPEKMTRQTLFRGKK